MFKYIPELLKYMNYMKAASQKENALFSTQNTE